jgi:YD repeat-containing protein
MLVSRPDGRLLFFKPGADSYAPDPVKDPEVTLSLVRKLDAGGALNALLLKDPDAGTFETYAPSGGKVSAITRIDGTTTSIVREVDRVVATDVFGRSIKFNLDLANGATSGLDLPDQSVIRYDYRPGDGLHAPVLALIGVTRQDATVRGYDYISSGGLKQIVDENQALFAQWTYTSNTSTMANTDLATSSSHGGALESWSVGYLVSGVEVTDPNGSKRSFRTSGDSFGSGAPYTSISQPAGSGCLASTMRRTYLYAWIGTNYVSRGVPDSEDDFNGKRQCFGYEPVRPFETARVAGLSNTAYCGSYTTVGASLPAGSRKVSTQWHPDWKLKTRVAEPGRITTYVYNGQPDPLAGNAVAACAPATALLPDGKPIVVLCRQVEQATTDANGAQGFAAALQAGVASREQKWTYNQYGQVLTHDGPRTDVSDVTTYAYYTDTTADHTRGDLWKVTNALGKVTTYNKYNKHGQVLTTTDPNGVVTTNTYDLRMRLKSSSVGGQTTFFDYDAVGQLKKVTRPDASWVGYDYDNAHRQVAAYDGQGNRIDYVLDGLGNRVSELVKDPAGVLRKQLTRSVDALGRVQQVTGRE